MKQLICVVLVTLVALIGPKSSEASMHLMLTSGATSVTIDDGGAGDLNAVAGAITFVGAVGSWTINVSTGIGFPVLGSLTLPHMDLNSVNTSVSAGVPDPLTVKFTQTDNTGDVPFLALIGGTTSGTVTYNVYADSSNAAFGMADLVTTFTTAAAGAFANTQSGSSAETASTYSITQEVTITHGAGTRVSSFDAELQSVPEPSAILVWGGLALAGMGAARRRCRKAA